MATYISFPMGTLGHPADLEVEVRLVRTEDWSHIVQRIPLFGGQGTINVNSWSPDGRRFAYVAYPMQSNPICSSSDRIRKVFRYRSSTFPSTGLRSTIGVPSMASRPLT